MNEFEVVTVIGRPAEEVFAVVAPERLPGLRLTMLGIDPEAPPAANRAPGTSDPLTAPDYRSDDRDSGRN